MKSLGLFGLPLVFALAPLVAACGSEDPANGDAAPNVDSGPRSDADTSSRYLPMEVGRVWTYQVTPIGGAPEIKTSTVEALEDIGGEKAGTTGFRVRTEKPDGVTVSWQEDTGTAIVRHREQEQTTTGSITVEEYYVPFRTRLDESPAHLENAAAWSESFTNRTVGVGDTARQDQWTVEAVDEQVTVPAGTFSCIKVHRVGADAGQADKRYWFARGVGKVKEEGGQLEELMATSAP